MNKVSDTIRHLFSLRKEPLYMNSVFMMASTGMVSVSGFFFWIIAAHLYTDTQVGLATAIISVILFIMNLSILGLNYSIIRFLPKAKDKNELISTSLLSVSIASALCAGIFLLFLPFFSEKLVFMHESPVIAIAFFFLTIAVSIDFVTEGIFLAHRSGKYIFLKNLLVSVLKLVLPIFFIPLGANGIFIAWALALSSALLISFWVLVKKFNFSPTRFMNPSKLSQLIKFSSANYIVGLLGIAPEFILPVLITNAINPQTAAYFYMAFMMANLLYTIPFATTQSLFAEGSHKESSFFINARKASKLIGALLIPGILVFIFFGHYILLLFGKSYSTEGLQFLQLLAISGIPVAFNYMGLTYVNVHRKMKALITINTIGIGAIILLSYLLREYGLTGIGIAWLAGHLLKNVLYGGYIWKKSI